MSDRKFAVPSDTSSLIDHYEPHIVTAQDYYPFGMLSRVDLPGSGKSYKFGFNGKMNDDEVKGGLGNQQDYGMRIYDPRVGRFLSFDPLTKDYPWYTPYQFAGNTPIQAIDVDGLEPAYPYRDSKGQWRETHQGDNLSTKNIPSGHEQFLRNTTAFNTTAQNNEAFSHALNWVPFVGEVKGAWEGLTGEEMFTGRKLSALERKACLLPMKFKGGGAVVRGELKQEVRAITREEATVAKSSAKAEMTHGNAAAAEANAGGKGNFVYRGLSEDDVKSINSGQGINAKNPNATNSAVSHVAGKENTRWISTTFSEEIAKSKYGESGYVKIDLDKVKSDKVFLNKGFPYMKKNATYHKWAKKNLEVLIEKHIPQEAISKPNK